MTNIVVSNPTHHTPHTIHHSPIIFLLGKCESECKTIEKSCQDMLEDEVEVDDLSAYLWRKKSYSVKEVQV